MLIHKLSHCRASDPSANRYMLRFRAGNAFTVDGQEFVSCTVLGQSFMLHQIRKMMGAVIAVMRGVAPDNFLETALSKKLVVNVPTAPELGLFLQECVFESYNKKHGNIHGESFCL